MSTYTQGTLTQATETYIYVPCINLRLGNLPIPRHSYITN